MNLQGQWFYICLHILKPLDNLFNVMPTQTLKYIEFQLQDTSLKRECFQLDNSSILNLLHLHFLVLCRHNYWLVCMFQ